MGEPLATNELVAIGRRVIADEAAGLKCLSDALDDSFAEAVRLIQSLRGHLVVTGLGKSGLIARKVAATLTSTGTPATFMHPVEAMHGDIGLVNADDALLAFSKSGSTDEIIKFILHFRHMGGAVIAVTAEPRSRIAELSSLVIRLPDRPEACPLNLAPTASTSMMLSLGDALAMVLVEARGFKPEDFARYHPDGSLGKRLLLRAGDLMHAGDELPVVRIEQSFEDLLRTIDEKALGLACIVDREGRFLGVFTDGDLRRLIRRCPDPMSLSLKEAFRISRRAAGDVPVTQSTVRRDMPLIDCRQIMRDSKITALVVADEHNRPIGIVRQHDIVAIGLG
jgi:arabinose-5-phosphate isomerase